MKLCITDSEEVSEGRWMVVFGYVANEGCVVHGIHERNRQVDFKL